MVGAGNDFVVVDNRDMVVRENVAEFAQRVCDRKLGVGSDGLLLLEPSSKADFFMRYYNADGSSGGMCGNGGRCIAKFAHILGIVRETMTFEALGFVYRAHVQDDIVRLHMKNTSSIQSVTVRMGFNDISGYVINTGAPHVVLFADELGVPLEQADMNSIGSEIRWNKIFQPEGTNVNVVQLQRNSRVYNRTFERGVEGETLSCGTGCVAAAIVVAARRGLTPPIIVQTQSARTLVVDFSKTQNTFADVILEGDARVTFFGQLQYDETEKTIA